MSVAINMHVQANTLYLEGVLTSETIKLVWDQGDGFSSGLEYINVAKLERVDSSGLALIVYYCIKYKVKLVEPTLRLKTLIDLYDLESVF